MMKTSKLCTGRYTPRTISKKNEQKELSTSRDRDFPLFFSLSSPLLLLSEKGKDTPKRGELEPPPTDGGEEDERDAVSERSSCSLRGEWKIFDPFLRLGFFLSLFPRLASGDVGIA